MGVRVAEKRPLGAVTRGILVASMHVLVLFVIAQGVGIKLAAVKPPDDIETTLISEKPDLDVIPPVVPRDFTPPDIYVPEPDVTIDDPAAEPPRAQALPEQGPVLPQAGSAEPVPRIDGVRQLARGLSQPPYPPALVREGVEGATVLEVYVLPTGRVGDARVVTSSGYADFDRSAVQEAMRNWRFAPATRDGVPMAQWHRLRVVFKLQNAR
jgi:periplasmic protein TonB